jgi:hypothetical protein
VHGRNLRRRDLFELRQRAGMLSRRMPGTGISLSGPPASFTSVRFQLVADDLNGTTASFNFCVDQLSF